MSDYTAVYITAYNEMKWNAEATICDLKQRLELQQQALASAEKNLKVACDCIVELERELENQERLRKHADDLIKQITNQRGDSNNG